MGASLSVSFMVCEGSLVINRTVVDVCAVSYLFKKLTLCFLHSEFDLRNMFNAFTATN